MKKQLIALLATAPLLLNCAQKSSADSLEGDTRFLTAGSNIGFTPDELIEKNGFPMEESPGGCSAPLFQEDKDPIAVKGDAWKYSVIGEGFYAQLLLCLVDDYVVDEKLEYVVKEGGRVIIETTETLDEELLKKVVNHEMDSTDKKERQIPRSEDEIEI